MNQNPMFMNNFNMNFNYLMNNKMNMMNYNNFNPLMINYQMMMIHNNMNKMNGNNMKKMNFSNPMINNFNQKCFPINQNSNLKYNMIKNNHINNNINNNNIQEKKLNQIVGIESVIPIHVPSKKVINEHEYDIITQICVEAIKNKRDDITQYCTEKIIDKIKGQWFILIHNYNDNNYEFKFSKIKDNNILIFKFREKIIYVCRIN